MQKILNSTVWNLRNKISASIVTLLLLLGLASILITHTILLKVLKTEFQHKGLSLSRSIAANSLVDVLTQNTPRLKQLIENEKKLDKDLAYVFIVNSAGQILAHTFNKGFPIDLAKANKLGLNKDANTQLLDTQMGIIYDIAVPIFLERNILGQVRIGILQNSIQKAIMLINLAFIGAMLLIVLMGIFLAYKISSLITKPISKLVEATKLIQRGDFSAKIDIKTQDEIELLASAFNEMASRLNSVIEEKKQLTLNKERDRIAIDFHDGCAQDLANIIKRLELASRLLKVDPALAEEELSALKEFTKGTLNMAREIIFDLKSPDDINFNLLNKLKTFVKDFERANNINVKFDVPETVNDIPHAKAKSIFYIITEAFTNVRKHSQARNVELSIKYADNEELDIEIKDDGQGFDDKAAELSAYNHGKWGLINMRQRAIALGGTLAISSALRQGTKISANIPFKITERLQSARYHKSASL